MMKTSPASFVRSTYVVVLVHLAAWLCFFCVPFLLFSIQIDKLFFTLRFVIPNLLLALFFYANMLFLVPRFLQAQKHWTYITIVASCVVILSLLDVYLEKYYFLELRSNHPVPLPLTALPPNSHPGILSPFPSAGSIQSPFPEKPLHALLQGQRVGSPIKPLIVGMPYTFVVLKSSLLSLLALAISTSLKITGEWYRHEQQRKALENERLNAELVFLKSQVNPHFFFNTLNNIYSLAHSKSDDAPIAIAKLSQLMRYMLYESNVNLVPLSKEIEYLHNFIDLQRLRFKDGNRIEFRIEGETEDKMIEPMLFLPFVENAFKHGAAHQQNPDICLALYASSTQLIFRISNTFEKSLHPEISNQGGIGLQNIQRRLNLLYPQNHQLHICKQENIFIAELTLTLS